MSLGVVFVVLMIVAVFFVLVNPFKTNTGPTPPQPPNSATLSLQVTVPSSALYGSQVDVKEIASSQGQPALNPKLTLTVSLGNSTIYTTSQPIDLTSTSTQHYTVTLIDQNSVIQPSVGTATLQSTLSADNGKTVLNSTSIQLWKPSATLNVNLPNSCVLGVCMPYSTPPLSAGTYLFKDASVQYTGIQPGTFQVAVGVVLDQQTTPYFQMNSKLAQSFNDNGKTIWIVSSDAIDSAHPIWKVPLDPTEFKVSTGGIPKATINFDIVLYLIVGNGHYLPLFTIHETLQINQS